MQLLSSEEYQDRINPWLNNNLNVAHCIPVPFPKFRSVITNEVFLFVLTVMIFAAMYAGSAIFFSLLGLSSNSNVIDSLVGAFENSKALILFSLFVLIYLRVSYFILSKLNNESSVMIVGFLVMMLIPFIADGLPVLEAWMNDSAINYYSSLTQPGLMMWAFASFVLTRKLLKQFREAKIKKATLSD